MDDDDVQVPRGTQILITLAFAAAALSLVLTVIDNNLKKQVIRESVALREAVRNAGRDTGEATQPGDIPGVVRGRDVGSHAGSPQGTDADAPGGGGVAPDIETGA